MIELKGSTAIVGVEFIEDQKVMNVFFTNGAQYAYENVDTELFNGLLQAKSVGAFFNKFIRPLGKRN